MRVDAIAFLGIYGAIAVVWNFGDDGCCDRFFEVIVGRSQLI
jgi:hypothetical protein